MVDLHWMVAPVAACLVVALPLAWFGLHVLQRGVIFVDLALAQVAALGTTCAVYLGHEPSAPTAYALSVVFTAVGALCFSLARHFEDRVPQEAIIGIAYAVTAGGAALVLELASDPHGAEKLQHLMVGNVVWVRWAEIGSIAAVAGLVLGVHYLVRERLLQVSFRPAEAVAEGRAIGGWDMLFYLTFGFVLTSMVPVAGVLLIFSFLVIPAVIARLFADGLGGRLALACGVVVPVSVLGVGVSYEHAAGPVIVVLLGLCLLVALAAHALRRSPRPWRLAGRLLGGVLVLGAVLGAFSRTSPAWRAEHAEAQHEEDHHHHAAPDLADQDPGARERHYRSELGDVAALREALALEEDPSLRLLLATALVRQGDAAGLEGLAALAASEVPFLRLEADDRLRVLAGATAPTFDPLTGPDSEGLWREWVRAVPAGWEGAGATVALP